MKARNLSISSLLVLVFLLNFPVQFLHEAAHWAVYQAYGRQPVWGFTALVQMWDKQPLHPEQWAAFTSPDGDQGWLRLASAPDSTFELFISSAAGPLASLLIAVLGLLLSKRSRRPVAKYITLGLSLVTSFVMTTYYLRSPLHTGGDEYYMAAQFSIPKLFIEIPLGLAFAACLAFGLRELQGWRMRLTWLAALVVGGIPAAILISYADSAVRSQVDLGNPLFQSVIGFSLPVLLVPLAALGGLWLWFVRMRAPVAFP
ncbi:MAG: hypothetical protein WD751_03195 [Anaerolineales bacterium]